MSYLPGRCDACGFVVLVPHPSPATYARSCPKCDADVAIFPGAKHQDDERTVFEALSEQVHSSTTPGDAAGLLAELEDLEEGAEAMVLAVIAGRLPMLAPRLEGARDGNAPVKLVPMLLTMLRARSSIRMRSGFEPRRAAPRGDEAAVPIARRVGG
jgi:hypothetical protein